MSAWADIVTCCYRRDKIAWWCPESTPTARAVYFDGGGGNGDKPGNRISAVIGDRYSARTVPSHFAAVTDVFARDGFMP